MNDDQSVANFALSTIALYVAAVEAAQYFVLDLGKTEQISQKMYQKNDLISINAFHKWNETKTAFRHLIPMFGLSNDKERDAKYTRKRKTYRQVEPNERDFCVTLDEIACTRCFCHWLDIPE